MTPDELLGQIRRNGKRTAPPVLAAHPQRDVRTLTEPADIYRAGIPDFS
jgi:hypothetical protein